MVSEAQKRATKEYKKKAYKRIPLDVRIEEYEELKKYCEIKGLSINGFIRQAIKKALPI